MSSAQLSLAIGIPMAFQTLLTLVLLAHLNARFDGLRDLWRAELRRV